MEFSRLVQSSPHTVPSPTSDLLAVLSPSASQLHILTLPALQPYLVIDLAPSFTSQISTVRWSSASPLRLLVATPTSIHIYTPSLSNASASRPTYTLNLPPPTPSHIAFSPSSSNELLILTPSLTLTIALLSSTSPQTITIRDPKLPSERSYSFRPTTSHLALLTRPSAHDVLSIHAPSTHAVVATTVLPTTDAQGLKWSPTGHWLAVWDSPGAGGYRVVVLTADGQVFRTWCGSEEQLGLGVRAVEWCGRHLAVGDHSGKVTLLNDRTFSPALILSHALTLTHAPHAPIHEETIAPSGAHIYAPPAQPTISLPIALALSSSHPTAQPAGHGISTLSYNARSSLLATKSDTHPSTVWLWDLSSSSPKITPVAVLIHRSQVQTLHWHPSHPDLLLILTAAEEDSADVRLYLWTHAGGKIVFVPGVRCVSPVGSRANPKVKVKVHCLAAPGQARLVVDDGEHFLLCGVSSLGGEQPVGQGAYEPLFDCSLSLGDEEGEGEGVEDTFRFRGESARARGRVV